MKPSDVIALLEQVLNDVTYGVPAFMSELDVKVREQNAAATVIVVANALYDKGDYYPLDDPDPVNEWLNVLCIRVFGYDFETYAATSPTN